MQEGDDRDVLIGLLRKRLREEESSHDSTSKSRDIAWKNEGKERRGRDRLRTTLRFVIAAANVALATKADAPLRFALEEAEHELLHDEEAIEGNQ